MGCVKSKRSENANSSERAEGAAYLVHAGETGSPPQSDLEVNPVLLDYAHKLSEDIVAQAVQQWAELDRRYCDIPYIECDD
ncbi:small membrane A-kinase anchor protein-like [Pseudoliparis swirei]|uniref:small membrane A-kinase anchor protein-like n=1 Tax=Pseudoliparis swirei TaxID=2059687 RepID=UPI0024BEB5F4|nr:small membrane A-kinase anchor protein-like [Pseudoliparis swirei]